MKEGVDYRVRKWLFQQLPYVKGPDQFQRLQETDWDILIVLDACRADTLQRASNWPVETATSPASCTPYWLNAVSASEVLQGAHVVSGNPQYEKVNLDFGCERIESFWKSHWDTALQTTLPEPILNRSDELIDNNSAGIVAHLQQPHWPYVAKLGGEWQLADTELGP